LTETFAVNVTDCPNPDGFVPELTLVVVLALLTVSDAALDVALPHELVTTTS
jgi:hypothetical protein